MAGLLAFPKFASLMSGMNPAELANPPRMMADAEDERMFAANPNGDQLNQLLGAFLLGQNPQPQAAPTPAVQPAPGGAIATPQRARVSPWRVLDRVLGGETITGGLDNERARLTTEAMRPQMLAQEQENERIARALGPQALLALRTNPEAFGESVGYQYRPQVVANGAIQSTPGMGQTLENRDEIVFGDKLVSVGQDGVQDLATRQPTFDEQNDAERNRIAAIGAGQTTVGPYRIDAQGNTIFEAPDDVTLSQGQTRFRDGQATARVAPNTPPSPVNIELQGRIDSARRETLPTATQMRQLLSSGDVITGFGANARLDAARALAALGNEGAKRQVAATQQYQNLSGALRVSMAKALGANPSNADLMLLKEITAGDINQSPEALLSTVGLAEQRANTLVSDLQRQLTTAGAGQGGAAASGPIATNPQTGEQVQWNGSAWVPL